MMQFTDFTTLQYHILITCIVKTAVLLGDVALCQANFGLSTLKQKVLGFTFKTSAFHGISFFFCLFLFSPSCKMNAQSCCILKLPLDNTKINKHTLK